MPEELVTTEIGEVVEVSEEQQAVLNDEASKIAGAEFIEDDWDFDGPSSKQSQKENQTSDTEQAPIEGNADEDQPLSDGQTSDDQAQVDGEEKDEKAKDNDSLEAESDEDKAKRVENEHKELIAKKLGLQNAPKPEPTTLEEYKEALAQIKQSKSESSREAHRLAEEAKKFNTFLSENGLEIVQAKDGTPKFKNTNDYEEKYLADEDAVKDIVSNLTEDEKALFEDEESLKDAVSLIVKKHDLISHALRPEATAKAEDVLLPEVEVQNIISDMSQVKDSSGEERFPEVNTDLVLDLMSAMYLDPKFEPLHVLANQSKENFRMVMELYYDSVRSHLAPIKAAEADAKAQKELAHNVNKQDASVNTDGTGGKGGAVSSKNVDEALAIALADNAGDSDW